MRALPAADRRPGRWLRRFFRAPAALYRLHLGWLFGRRLALVEHTGRRTGQRHRTVLEVVERDTTTGALTVASGFGPQADWYRNLLAHPATEVVLGGRRFPARAEPVPSEAGGEIMCRYARHRRRMARRMVRVLGYEVDGTDADFVELGRTLPFLRLVPDEQTGIRRAA
jgi:deazaflavin-dependent oxidoreductase (nitroreductase family)